MGILTKVSQNKTSINSTRGFNFGQPEAEAEQAYINDFFQDFLGVLDGVANGKFIITGRKGAGKSAIAKYIDNDQDSTKCVLVDPTEVRFQRILQALPDIDCSLYFEWIILVRLVKMLLDTELAPSARYMSDLKKFYNRNTGAINIASYKVSEISSHQEVLFEVLKNSFPSIVTRFYRDKKEVKGAFYEFVPVLREILQTVLKYQVFEDLEFFICFDDLDVGFKLQRDSATLMELIRVAKRYNTQLFHQTKCRVLLFMRDDIQKHLEAKEADLTKIFGSYEFNISWFNPNDARISENKTNIKKFINRRIQYNFRKNGIAYNENDPWYTLFEECSRETSNKGSFKYILDHTFYRPRDLINVIKDLGIKDYSYPISFNTIQTLLNQYSEYCVGEIKNELSMLYSEDDINNIFKLLKTIAVHVQKPTFTKLMELFNENNVDEKWFASLLAYDIIIPIDNETNEIYCNYREKRITKDVEEYCFTLQKSIYVYFNRYKIR